MEKMTEQRVAHYSDRHLSNSEDARQNNLVVIKSSAQHHRGSEPFIDLRNKRGSDDISLDSGDGRDYIAELISLKSNDYNRKQIELKRIEQASQLNLKRFSAFFGGKSNKNEHQHLPSMYQDQDIDHCGYDPDIVMEESDDSGELVLRGAKQNIQHFNSPPKRLYVSPFLKRTKHLPAQAALKSKLLKSKGEVKPPQVLQQQLGQEETEKSATKLQTGVTEKLSAVTAVEGDTKLMPVISSYVTKQGDGGGDQQKKQEAINSPETNLPRESQNQKHVFAPIESTSPQQVTKRSVEEYKATTEKKGKQYLAKYSPKKSYNSPLPKIASLNSGTLRIQPSESQGSTLIVNPTSLMHGFLGDNLKDAKQKKSESESTGNLLLHKSSNSNSLAEMRANTMPKAHLRNYMQEFSDNKNNASYNVDQEDDTDNAHRSDKPIRADSKGELKMRMNTEKANFEEYDAHNLVDSNPKMKEITAVSVDLYRHKERSQNKGKGGLLAVAKERGHLAYSAHTAQSKKSVPIITSQTIDGNDAAVGQGETFSVHDSASIKDSQRTAVLSQKQGKTILIKNDSLEGSSIYLNRDMEEVVAIQKETLRKIEVNIRNISQRNNSSSFGVVPMRSAQPQLHNLCRNVKSVTKKVVGGTMQGTINLGSAPATRSTTAIATINSRNWGDSSQSSLKQLREKAFRFLGDKKDSKDHNSSKSGRQALSNKFFKTVYTTQKVVAPEDMIKLKNRDKSHKGQMLSDRVVLLSHTVQGNDSAREVSNFLMPTDVYRNHYESGHKSLQSNQLRSFHDMTKASSRQDNNRSFEQISNHIKDPYSNISVEAFLSARGDQHNQESVASKQVSKTSNIEVLKSDKSDPFDTLQMQQNSSIINQMQSDQQPSTLVDISFQDGAHMLDSSIDHMVNLGHQHIQQTEKRLQLQIGKKSHYKTAKSSYRAHGMPENTKVEISPERAALMPEFAADFYKIVKREDLDNSLYYDANFSQSFEYMNLKKASKGRTGLSKKQLTQDQMNRRNLYFSKKYHHRESDQQENMTKVVYGLQTDKLQAFTHQMGKTKDFGRLLSALDSRPTSAIKLHSYRSHSRGNQREGNSLENDDRQSRDHSWAQLSSTKDLTDLQSSQQEIRYVDLVNQKNLQFQQSSQMPSSQKQIKQCESQSREMMQASKYPRDPAMMYRDIREAFQRKQFHDSFNLIDHERQQKIVNRQSRSQAMQKRGAKQVGARGAKPKDLEEVRRELMQSQTQVTKYLMNLSNKPREALKFMKSTTTKGDKCDLQEASSMPSKLSMMKDKYIFKKKQSSSTKKQQEKLLRTAGNHRKQSRHINEVIRKSGGRDHRVHSINVQTIPLHHHYESQQFAQQVAPQFQLTSSSGFEVNPEQFPRGLATDMQNFIDFSKGQRLQQNSFMDQQDSGGNKLFNQIQTEEQELLLGGNSQKEGSIELKTYRTNVTKTFGTAQPSAHTVIERESKTDLDEIIQLEAIEENQKVLSQETSSVKLLQKDSNLDETEDSRKSIVLGGSSTKNVMLHKYSMQQSQSNRSRQEVGGARVIVHPPSAFKGHVKSSSINSINNSTEGGVMYVVGGGGEKSFVGTTIQFEMVDLQDDSNSGTQVKPQEVYRQVGK